MVIPQTLNFQSGIAEDTLLFGSFTKQIGKQHKLAIPANASFSSGIDSDFFDRTAYSVGIGRKIN